MTPDDFENVLNDTVSILTENLRSSTAYHNPNLFQQHVLDMLKVSARGRGVEVTPSFHPHAFPDIRVNSFGVEVKFTKRDTWLAVGNSIFEGMRDPDVKTVYMILGKAGGNPEARWARYEECITHVRISHSPRFVVELDGGSQLFNHLSVSYDEFQHLSDNDKMRHIRDYSRNRLKEGERLWWLEDQDHALPIEVRLYTRLTNEEKRVLRAEAALLCPQICKPSRARGKYDSAALYLLTHHGVFCPQTRDLFSAGSVALRSDDTRGGNYVLRALQDIQEQMEQAAEQLDDALFVEYWGEECPPKNRIKRWLELADEYARDWLPSKELFTEKPTYPN